MPEYEIPVGLDLPQDQKIEIAAAKPAPKRPKKRIQLVTLEFVKEVIRERGLAPHIESKLIEKASHYPHGALPKFLQDIQKHIKNSVK